MYRNALATMSYQSRAGRVSGLLAVGIAIVFSGCGSGERSSTDFDSRADWAAAAFPAPVVLQDDLVILLERETSGDVLLVDTRSPDEFAVSRLPGAISWPEYRRGEIPEEVTLHVANGKPVVFYCSIGYRSGEAAARVIDELGKTDHVHNLRGGIFQWANEDRVLEGADRVHPYDSDWGRLLREDLRAVPAR